MKPTIHQVIRDALTKLSDSLSQFEQTTNGYVGPHDAEAVCHLLCRCYESPSAVNISKLSQAIERFLEDAA